MMCVHVLAWDGLCVCVQDRHCLCTWDSLCVCRVDSHGSVHGMFCVCVLAGWTLCVNVVLRALVHGTVCVCVYRILCVYAWYVVHGMISLCVVSCVCA